MAKPKLETIACLSVRNPYIHWLLNPHPRFGPKIFENRNWTSRFRGRLFLHASRWDSPPVADENGEPDPDDLSLWRIPKGRAGPVSHILGSVDLVTSAGQRDVEEAFHKIHGMSRRTMTPFQQLLIDQFLPTADDPGWFWWTGLDVLIVRNPQILVTPVPCSGQRGIFRRVVESDRLAFRPQHANRKRRRRTRGQLRPPQEE